MKRNEILDEIYRARDAIAREAGDDTPSLLAWIQAEEAKARALGVKFTLPPMSPAESSVVREEPPLS